jgi:voltage-gated potassium channel Kch
LANGPDDHSVIPPSANEGDGGTAGPLGPQADASLPWWRSSAFRQAVRASDSYGLLLALLLLDYVLLSLIQTRRWSDLVVGVPIELSLLLAMHTSRANIHAIRLARLAGVLVVTLGIVSAFTGQNLLSGAIGFLFCVLLIVSIFVILRRVLGHERVGTETILGALCVYIMIGLMFTFLFIAIARVSTTPFLAQPPPYHSPADYLYLSFVTLTTVGFGDLTPASKLARSVVVLEALMGQVFLVTLVARLVALFGTEQRRSEADVARERRDASNPESP